MHLVLVRHGDAEPELAAPVGLGDPSRALTALGREQTRETAHWLGATCGGGPHQIWTSPLVRTVQTAEILAEAWRDAEVAVAGPLRPGQSVARQLDLIAGLPAIEWAALVGHEPQLSQLGAELLGVPGLPFPFEKGAALLLARQGERWVFEIYRAPGEEAVRELPKH